MVMCLVEGRFDELSKSVSNRVSDLLDCEPIAGLIAHAGEKTIQAYVAAEIVKLAGNLNVNPALNLKAHQIPVIAESLCENYKWESLEDFTLCFRRAAAGIYGEIYRLDGAVIGQWMARYLDEKYDALEQRKAKEKPVAHISRAAPDVAQQYISKWLDQLGAPKQQEENNAKENAYQRSKIEYQSPDEDYVIKKQLHVQYVRENYDTYGNKKSTWIPESEWLQNLND